MTTRQSTIQGTGAGRRWRRLREFFDDQTELQERLLLINRPWEEELLHWCGSGPDAVLHGHVTPRADGRRRSVTGYGWCLGHARWS